MKAPSWQFTVIFLSLASFVEAITIVSESRHVNELLAITDRQKVALEEGAELTAAWMALADQWRERAVEAHDRCEL